MVCNKPRKIDTANAWLDQELAGFDRADDLLNQRLRKSLAHVGGTVGQSVPLVCQDWANTAYRFPSNEQVNEADILAGHFRAIGARIANHDGLILMLHDTTEFTYRRRSGRPRVSTVAGTKPAVGAGTHCVAS